VESNTEPAQARRLKRSKENQEGKKKWQKQKKGGNTTKNSRNIPRNSKTGTEEARIQ
jgi:hypothetical protein